MQASKCFCFKCFCLLSLCAKAREEEESFECHESSLLQAGVYLQNEKSSSSYASPLWPGDTGANDLSSFDCSEDYLLVYSRAKTASTSIMYSFLNLCGLSDDPKYWGTQDLQETYSRFFKSHNHEVASDYVSKLPKDSRLWIFTMTRNPFNRAASFFFESDKDNGHFLEQGIDDVATYISAFHSAGMLHNESTLWYQESENKWFYEFESATGVAVTGTAFDHHRSHLFISSVNDTKTKHVVLLRMEDIAQWPYVLAEYAPGFVLEERNDASDDLPLYAPMYEQFKHQFMYSDYERSKLLASDVLQYYNNSEVASMMSGQMVGFPR